MPTINLIKKARLTTKLYYFYLKKYHFLELALYKPSQLLTAQYKTQEVIRDKM